MTASRRQSQPATNQPLPYVIALLRRRTLPARAKEQNSISPLYDPVSSVTFTLHVGEGAVCIRLWREKQLAGKGRQESPRTNNSWAGVKHHTSGAVFLVHHAMPSSGGAVGAQWYVPSGGGSSDLNSSMSCGSSVAFGALQLVGSLASSRRGSSHWGDSTRCLLHSGSTTGRWCVGPSATRFL